MPVRLEARFRRFVRWLRGAWEDGVVPPPNRTAAAVGAPALTTAPPTSAKQPEGEQVRAQARAEEHRENVWLAVGSLVILAGVGVMTAAWLHTAPPTEMEPHPATLFDRDETWIPFIAGAGVVIVGGFILLAFFWERLGRLLPETTTEKRRRKPISKNDSETESSAQPKPAEGGGAQVPAQVASRGP